MIVLNLKKIRQKVSFVYFKKGKGYDLKAKGGEDRPFPSTSLELILV